MENTQITQEYLRKLQCEVLANPVTGYPKTHKEMAEIFGVSERSWRRWVSGDYALHPPMKVLIKLVEKGLITFEQVKSTFKEVQS